MRKNRKVSQRMSRISVYTMHIGAVLVTLFLMVIFNIVATSKCSERQKSIVDKEKILKENKKELERNAVKWDMAKSTSNLEFVLKKRGMAMYHANLNNVVRMDESGAVLPSQTSVALLRRKKQERATVHYEGARFAGRKRRVIR